MQHDTRIQDPLTTDRSSPRAALIPVGDGAHHHFLDHLATVVVGSDALASGLTAVLFDSPQGFGPPLHVHHEDDEIIYLIEGRMRVCVDGLDDTVEDGAVAVLPRGVPHAFQVLSESARFLSITASPTGPAGFDRFVGELGTPILTTDLPPAVGIDPGRVAQVGSRHGIEVLGPPLGIS